MTEYNLGPYRPRPCGEFDSSTRYRYLDLVTYNGSSFICINIDTIDEVDSTGILPEGQEQSELYWQCIAHKGDKGDKADRYQSFIEVEDGIWDYNLSDKIIIKDFSPPILEIQNVYDGCCGIIISKKDLALPINSYYSIDYNYITLETNQCYLYTFVYAPLIIDTEGNKTYKFIWNRIVINL